MRNKKAKSIIAIILALLMLFSLLFSVIPVVAHAVSQADIDAVKAERDSLDATIAAYQEKLEAMRSEQATTMAQKDVLDERNLYVKEQIATVNTEISLYEAKIEEEKNQVDAARAKEEHQLDLYRTRVRAMEERGSYNILSLIVKADNFSELITAIDDFGEIMQSDRELEDAYIAAREEYEAVLTQYESDKAVLDAELVTLQNDKAELEGMLDEVNQLLAALEQDVAKAEAEQQQYQKDREEAEAQIAALVQELNEQNARIAAEKAAAAAAAAQQGSVSASVSGGTGDGGGVTGAVAAGVIGTGSLCWPVPSSNRVSSCFKMRNGRQHNGLDIDGYGLDGNPVVACDNGVVVTSTCSGSYGYYVMIDHGNGMQTLYAHMSGNAVSVGQTVSAGQTIGYLGRSGNATGTHCHLEVIINGGYTDPLAYFGGYVLEEGAAD